MIFHTAICVAGATNCNYRGAELIIQFQLLCALRRRPLMGESPLTYSTERSANQLIVSLLLNKK